MLSVQYPALRVRGNLAESVKDHLVVEEPLQIRVNGQAFSITMRSPGADSCLVKGLLFTEGLARPEGLTAPIQFRKEDGYTVAEVSIPTVFLCEDLMEKRSLLSTAACGICGQKDAGSLFEERAPLSPATTLDKDLLPQLEAAVRSHQEGFRTTGGSHAATAFTTNGKIITQYEDVGRHNAVDKVIGYLLETEAIGKAPLLHVSGRVSYEIVSKAYTAGIPFLCAVSAPSSLAVQLAQRLGITLIAFCRDDRFTIYSHSAAVQLEAPVP